MNPFQLKQKIDTCFALAKECGFELKHRIDACFALDKECGFDLREHGPHYTDSEIYLYAAPDNKVFAKDICIQRFSSWEIAEAFFAGYLKCELAYKAGGKK